MELTKNQRNVLNNRKWRQNHKEEMKIIGREYSRRWRAANPDKNKAKQKRSNTKRSKTLKAKLNSAISVRMCKSLHGVKAYRRWEDLTGYTIEKLKKHLEKQFTADMTWNNYATYWHLDHKIPITAFNYEKPEDADFKKCWALKNLQPLEAKANISKGASIEKPFQPSLIL